MGAAPAFAVDERLLPPQARVLVRGIGFPDTLKILKARGGTRIRRPLRGEASPILVNLVGEEKAAKVVQLFEGSEFIDFPMCDKLIQQIRDAEIRTKRPGTTLHALALEYGLTRRWIMVICGEDQAEKHPDLFAEGPEPV
jgi:hypothetical protein